MAATETTKYVTEDEAARALNVTKRQLQAQIRAGRIPVIDLGKKTRRIDLEALAPKPIEQPTQAQVGKVLRRCRRDLPPVPDHLGDL